MRSEGETGVPDSLLHCGSFLLERSYLHIRSDSHSSLTSLFLMHKKGICQPAFAENSKQASSGCWLSGEEHGVKDRWRVVDCLAFAISPIPVGRKEFCLRVTQASKAMRSPLRHVPWSTWTCRIEECLSHVGGMASFLEASGLLQTPGD